MEIIYDVLWFELQWKMTVMASFAVWYYDVYLNNKT